MHFGPAHPFGVFFFFLAVLFQLADGAVGGSFFLAFLIFFVFEIFVFPDMGVEGGVDYVARIDDDVVTEGFEVGLAEVAAGGLQGIEKEAGGFVVDLLGDEKAHDLHEGDLDGVGVFEDGQDEGGNAATGAVGAELDAFVLKAFVEITEAVAAQGGRSALGTVDFEVLTTTGKL